MEKEVVMVKETGSRPKSDFIFIFSLAYAKNFLPRIRSLNLALAVAIAPR